VYCLFVSGIGGGDTVPPRNGNEFFPKTTYLSFDTGNTTAILGEALRGGEF